MTVEIEIRLAELEAQVGELEGQLNNAQSQLHQLATILTANVQALEAAMGDIERRALDLPVGDPQFTIPEVEAAIAIAKQRLVAVQGTTREIADYVAY